MPKGKGRSPASLHRLAEDMGEFMAFWGFKRVHGRLWTFLALADQPLNAGQLIQRLRVSKALMSLSLHELLRFELILPAEGTTQGKRCYRINPEVKEVIARVLASRERKMIDRIGRGLKTVSVLSIREKRKAGISPQALSVWIQLNRASLTALDQFIGHFKVPRSRRWRVAA